MAALDQWKLAIFVDGTETPDAEDFRRRVQLLAVKVAKLVAGEAQSTFTLQQWRKRGALAATILGTQVVGDPPTAKSGSEIWLDSLALATAENATITAASTDNDIEFTITSAWDDLAGVTGQDLA